jgi:hypothetical protein
MTGCDFKNLFIHENEGLDASYLDRIFVVYLSTSMQMLV